MPGIVGLITKIGRERAEPQVRAMVQALSHESFYETGTWIDEAAGVYVGWIARNSTFPGGRPLESERQGKTLFVSGEDFSTPAAPFYEKNGDRLNAARGAHLVELAEQEASFPA